MQPPEAPIPAVQFRTGPATRPLVLARPALIPIVDANALLIMGCDWIKRDREQDLISGLASTGRGTAHIAGHIPEELDRHVARLARKNKVPEAQVRQALDEVILPSAKLVELEIRDLLSPGATTIRYIDPARPKDKTGDPDDAPTMALAEFLAPAVIVSQDSVFYRFGFAAAAAEWIVIAKDLLRMVGLEADMAEAAMLTEFAMRLLFNGAAGLARWVMRHPWWATAALAAALWVCHKRGYLKGGRWREASQFIWHLAQPLLEDIGRASEDSGEIRKALITVEPPTAPVTEQIAARYLARCGQALTAAELRDALALRGREIPATHLKQAMSQHRGFIRLQGDRYTIGRAAHMPRNVTG